MLIKRFRPNLVISGVPAYDEESWSSATIGNCEFQVRFPVFVHIDNLHVVLSYMLFHVMKSVHNQLMS